MHTSNPNSTISTAATSSTPTDTTDDVVISTDTNVVDQTSVSDSVAVQPLENQRIVNMGEDEYAKFIAWVEDTKNRNIADIINTMKDKVGIRRQAIVLRRVDIKDVAPDEDVAAYQMVYLLKNPSSDSKNKTFVSDNEIEAYKVLNPKFDAKINLAAVTAKVEEMKAAGQLDSKGDEFNSDDDV